jgi:hypothetical protein
MLRNEWPASVGIGGRLRLESVADINRNRRPEWIGIRNGCCYLRIIVNSIIN